MLKNMNNLISANLLESEKSMILNHLKKEGHLCLSKASEEIENRIVDQKALDDSQCGLCSTSCEVYPLETTVATTYTQILITAPNIYSAAFSSVSDDPRKLDEALKGYEVSLWSAGISEECKSLYKNHVFGLKPIKYLPPNLKVLRGKFIFKRKRDKEGKVSRWKVRYGVWNRSTARIKTKNLPVFVNQLLRKLFLLLLQ